MQRLTLIYINILLILDLWLSLRPSVVCHPPFVLRVRPLLVTLVASRCAGVYEERREERANMETDQQKIDGSG